MTNPIKWIFDDVPASGARHGGLAQAEVFNKDIGTFVREVLQNARDQRLPLIEKVRVRFHLEEISGGDLDSFIESMAWSELEPHLDSIGAAGYVTISGRVRDSLESLRSTGKLRLLRIDDFGANGLTGDEDDPESNFNALCRHTLITPGGRRESGGSFGLGKSVLWRFSGFSTVLFSSSVSGASPRFRFFGRTLLAWHTTPEGEWEGSGWLGASETRPTGIRASSIWDDDADTAAYGCRLSRPLEDTGTSILIVGFDDPSVEDEPSIEAHCASFVEAAGRWFWPALASGDMEVFVEGFDETGEIYARQAHPTAEVEPFVIAQSKDADLVTVVAEPGEIAERQIALRVPAQRDDSFGHPRPEVQATATLRVRLAESEEEALQNSVALERGTGMIVQYHEPARMSLLEQPFHATLVAGTAHGDSDADRAAEEFLRAAEPVAHNEWTTTTDRLHTEYALGAQAALRQFLERIAAGVREMLRPPVSDVNEAPEALRKLFPLPTTGGGNTTHEPYRLSDSSGYVSDDRWDFTGTFSRSRTAKEEWRFRVAIHFDQEDGGSRENIPIVALHADPGHAHGPDESGWWHVTVPPNQPRVRFQGRTGPLEALPRNGIQRAGIRLDVRPVLGEP